MSTSYYIDLRDTHPKTGVVWQRVYIDGSGHELGRSAALRERPTGHPRKFAAAVPAPRELMERLGLPIAKPKPTDFASFAEALAPRVYAARVGTEAPADAERRAPQTPEQWEAFAARVFERRRAQVAALAK
jgi:hypothetical protein